MASKQKTYYVREDLAIVIASIAAREDRRVSDVVDEAFEAFVTSKLSKNELKVFGYKQEKQNGNGQVVTGSANGVGPQRYRHDSEHHGRDVALVGAGSDGAGANEYRPSEGPPGRKKRVG